MRKQTISNPQLAELKIHIPHELQQEVHQIAIQQGESLSEVICLAIAAYIDRYSRLHQKKQSRMSLKEARALMLELGRGLGDGHPPHNGAHNHDEYLYRHK